MMSADRKKILILCDWFLPGYKAGGPIRSVANVVNSLKEEADIKLITSDRDHHADQPYKSLQLNSWINFEKNVEVFYAEPEFKIISEIEVLIGQWRPDVIYLNSLFSKRFTIGVLRHLNSYSNPNFRIILATRGMLGKGALRIKSLKKMIFLKVSKLLKLYRNVEWQASSIQEKTEITDVFGVESNVHVAMNIPSVPDSEYKKQMNKVSGKLSLVFISRINRVKNILYALERIEEVKDGEITFHIYGFSDDPEYFDLCVQKIETLNGDIKIKGELKHEDVNPTLRNYHFLILPTHTENFGHVIFESLMAGTPVIISNNTPWRNLEKDGVGWDIDLEDKESFHRKLVSCLKMSDDEYQKMSGSAVTYANGWLANSDSVKQHREMFGI